MIDIKINNKNIENIVNSWIQYRKWEWKFSFIIFIATGILVLYFLDWLPKLFNL